MLTATYQHALLKIKVKELQNCNESAECSAYFGKLWFFFQIFSHKSLDLFFQTLYHNQGRVITPAFPKSWKLWTILIVMSRFPKVGGRPAGMAWRYGARTSPKEVPRLSPRTVALSCRDSASLRPQPRALFHDPTDSELERQLSSCSLFACVLVVMRVD